MPLYEYHDPETGVRVELSRHVEDRNKPIVLMRTKNIPDRLAVFGSQPTPEQSYDREILQGYYRQEQEQGCRFRSKYTKKHLAKVYAEAKTL